MLITNSARKIINALNQGFYVGHVVLSFSRSKNIGIQEIPALVTIKLAKAKALLSRAYTHERECLSPGLFVAQRANYNFTGNCNRLIDVGKSVGIIGISGIYARFPAAGPVRTIATTKVSRKSFINSLVSLLH